MDHGYGWLTIMLLFWECEYEDDGTASHVEKKIVISLINFGKILVSVKQK